MGIPKAVFCWSGGKDSSYCLHKVLSEKLFEVKYLLTTINGNYNRVSMHGVREELIEEQAKAIGIPLVKVKVHESSNEEYESLMKSALLKLKAEGIDTVIFGDIFLEDLRVYREKNLSTVNMKAVFPIWKLDTKFIINDFINKGFGSITCCISQKHLDKKFIGKQIDQEFINALPVNADPCGENGEYHTFCYKGPLFKNEIKFSLGEIVLKAFDQKAGNGFWFIDLLLS
jgi:uncharacterized protein (TIGR00290 family)